jgi:hypothetical protein
MLSNLNSQSQGPATGLTEASGELKNFSYLESVKLDHPLQTNASKTL